MHGLRFGSKEYRPAGSFWLTDLALRPWHWRLIGGLKVSWTPALDKACAWGDLADCVTATQIRVNLVLVLARARDDWAAEC